MISPFFGAEAAEGGGILGFDPKAFVIQLITFIFVFALLKKFAFNRIIALLEKRRQTIEDGVKLGAEMEAERDKLKQEVAKELRDARHEADRIIANAHKETRDMMREAEKSAHRKTEAMMADAEVRIAEETEQARRKLEKDIVGLVSEATEAVVEEKVDAKRDAELIDKAVKGRSKR